MNFLKLQYSIYKNLDLLEESEQAYLKVVATEPENEDIWLDIADLYYYSNELDKAIDILYVGIERHQMVARMYYRLAAYLLESGSGIDAFDILFMALETNREELDYFTEYYPEGLQNEQVLDLIESYRN